MSGQNGIKQILFQAFIVITVAIAIIASSGCTGGGGTQKFDTNFGQIQIKTPETLEPTFGSISGQGLLSGLSVLSLGKEGSGMPLLVITITETNELTNFQNSVSAAQMMMQDGRFLTTNDNHELYWTSIQLGSLKQYEGFINYENDKGLFVDIKGLSETVDLYTGETFPGLSENEALEIFKSFTFAENSVSSTKTTVPDTPSSGPDNTKPENIVLGPYVVSFDLVNIGAYSINVDQPEEDEDGSYYHAVIEWSVPSSIAEMVIVEGHKRKAIDFEEKVKENILPVEDCDEPTFVTRTIDGKPGTVVKMTCSEGLIDAIYYPLDYYPEDNTATSIFAFFSAFPEDESTSRDEVISNLLKTIHIEKQESSNVPSGITPASSSNGQESNTFHMVVIGDSIAWGNGLNEEDKYPYLVADWLEEELDRPVDVTVYAHSGATISGESGEAIDPNLNSASPTLMDQAKNIENKDDVDLILVSGGINDVDIINILNVYIPSDDIDQSAQSIQKPMKELLSYLLSECKNAKIVVTNYYPIVSGDSDIDGFALLYDTAIFGKGGNVLDALTLKDRLVENSYMFNGGSLTALTNAVLDADNGEKRITLAMVNFQPENCYAASQTWLWKFEFEELRTNDDQFDYRSSLTSDLINKNNALGHPNRDGAKEYARAIESAIESKWVADFEKSISQEADDSDITPVTDPTSGISDTSDANTKTAYTKDGITFISEERLEQNIRAGLTNLDEYEKVQVPLDTFVYGTSPGET